MDEYAACPACSQRIRVRQELRGRKVRCPKCQTVFRIAAGAVAEEPCMLLTPDMLATEDAGAQELAATDWVADAPSPTAADTAPSRQPSLPPKISPSVDELAPVITPPAVSAATVGAYHADPLAAVNVQSSLYEQYAIQMLGPGSSTPGMSSVVTGSYSRMAPKSSADSMLVWGPGVQWGLYLVAFGIATSILMLASLQFAIFDFMGNYSPYAGAGIGLFGGLLLLFSMLGQPVQALVAGGGSLILVVVLGFGGPWVKTSMGYPLIPPESSKRAPPSWVQKARELKGKQPETQPISPSNPLPGFSGGIPSNRPAGSTDNVGSGSLQQPARKAPEPAAAPKPTYDWRNVTLSDYPCGADFPLAPQTRWGSLVVGKEKLAFKEQFCDLPDGLQIAMGGLKVEHDAARQISPVSLRSAVLAHYKRGQEILSGQRQTVLGDKHPFAELRGMSRGGERAVRLRLFGNDSMLVWIVVAGRSGDVESSASIRSFDSFYSAVLDVSENEATWLVAALDELPFISATPQIASNTPPTANQPSARRPPIGNPFDEDDFEHDDPDEIVEGLMNQARETPRRFEITNQIHRLRRDMMQHRHTQRSTFGPDVLTPVVGRNAANVTYLIHPEQRPMLGLDFSFRQPGGYLEVICPVFDESAAHRILAQPGYAIGGLTVHERNQGIVGLKATFFKVQGRGFDTSDTIEGEWLGTPPGANDRTVPLAGDGRPVFGIYFSTEGFRVSGFGLVVDKL